MKTRVTSLLQDPLVKGDFSTAPALRVEESEDESLRVEESEDEIELSTAGPSRKGSRLRGNHGQRQKQMQYGRSSATTSKMIKFQEKNPVTIV